MPSFPGRGALASKVELRLIEGRMPSFPGRGALASKVELRAIEGRMPSFPGGDALVPGKTKARISPGFRIVQVSVSS